MDRGPPSTHSTFPEKRRGCQKMPVTHWSSYRESLTKDDGWRTICQHLHLSPRSEISSTSWEPLSSYPLKLYPLNSYPLIPLNFHPFFHPFFLTNLHFHSTNALHHSTQPDPTISTIFTILFSPHSFHPESVHLSIHPLINKFINSFIIHPSIRPSFHQSIHPSIHFTIPSILLLPLRHDSRLTAVIFASGR